MSEDSAMRKSYHEGCKLLRTSLTVFQTALNDVENEMNDFSDTFMPVTDKGWTSNWLTALEKSHVPPEKLPSLEKLPEFIKSELQVKIAVHKQHYDAWITKMYVPNYELMQKIFVVCNATPCVEIASKIGSRVVLADNAGLTEYSFVSFWNDMIRHVLDFVLPGIGISSRNSNQQTSTGLQHPDFQYVIDSICVLRGEEKDQRSSHEYAQIELTKKLTWTYGDVPYIFGYTAVAWNVKLYAITNPNDSETNNSQAKCLGDFSLKFIEGRFQLMLAIFNIARLLQSIASLCPKESDVIA